MSKETSLFCDRSQKNANVCSRRDPGRRRGNISAPFLLRIGWISIHGLMAGVARGRRCTGKPLCARDERASMHAARVGTKRKVKGKPAKS